MAATGSEDSSLKNSMFKKAMMGEWGEIVNHYRKDSTSHTQKITSSGDTALHVAVADSREDTVKELLEAISTSAGITKPKEILGMKNNEGNTPLHIAASMGSVAMCEEIAGHDSSLVGVQNSEGETPLFLAAQQGHKDAFLCLTQSCGRKEGYAYCTRTKDGQTVLHSAIFREHFDLAFQIICLYEDLVNKVNTDGEYPLNILARKPSAFESGSSFGRWESIIYRCIHVTPLKQAKSYAKKKTSSLNPKSRCSTWGTCFQSLCNVLLLGHTRVNRIKEQKENHTWSVQVMDKLLPNDTMYAYNNAGEWNDKDDEILNYKFENKKKMTISKRRSKKKWSRYTSSSFCCSSDSEEPTSSPPQAKNETAILTATRYEKKNGMTSSERRSKKKCCRCTSSSSSSSSDSAKPTSSPSRAKNDTAILTAARHGITEMVKAILGKYPVAVNDVDAHKKNIVLLAVEKRQLKLFKMLLNHYSPHNDVPSLNNDKNKKGNKPNIHVKDSAFRVVDIDGNSALHLAAKLEENHKPWSIPGEALQMQWEIKWYKKSMPPYFFVRYNNDGKSPEEVFTQSHKNHVKDGGNWLTSTSESCSVVAALIATVAFATSTAFPGGTDDNNGKPKLENQLAFTIFGITSLVALFFSVTSLAMFLSVLTSRYLEKDFEKSLPRKLLLGLSSLFVSVASIIISFCSGHFFLLKDKLKYAALPVYALTCLPISFFAAVQFPLYFDLIRTTFRSPFGKSSRAGKSKEGGQMENVPLKFIRRQNIVRIIH